VPVHYYAFFIKYITNLTVSTIGIIAKASAIETSKFAPESGVSLNMSFMPGTYITNSDKTKAITIAPNRTLLRVFNLKIDFVIDLRLRAWKTSHTDIVKNAIVVPVIWDCVLPIK